MLRHGDALHIQADWRSKTRPHDSNPDDIVAAGDESNDNAVDDVVSEQ